MTCVSWISESAVSPRSSSAFPPSAMTTLMPATSCRPAERGYHDGLDGVHPVFRLVEHDGGGRLEDLVGDLQCGQAAPFVELLPDLGLAVVQGGQAVHELHRGVPGGGHHLGVHLIREELVDAL